MRSSPRALAVAVAFSGALLARDARALKPCPADPCRRAEDGAFDPAACAAAAAWVAVGDVKVVERREVEADGVKLSFGDYDLAVERWEKGTGPAVVRFQTRWCWTDTRLDEPGRVRFRLYGLDDLGEAGGDRARIRAAEPVDAPAAPDRAPAQEPPRTAAPVEPPPRAARCGCHLPGGAAPSGLAWLVPAALLVMRRRLERRSLAAPDLA